MVPQQHFSDKGADPLPDVVGRLPSLSVTESAEQPDINVMIPLIIKQFKYKSSHAYVHKSSLRYFVPELSQMAANSVLFLALGMDG